MQPVAGAGQAEAVVAILRDLFREDLLAVYLHGSAVSGGLRPHSDIDLIAVVKRAMTDLERKSLLAALLRISGRHPALPAGPRCLELMVFLASDLADLPFPARVEFLYGEWLRDAFEQGDVPEPAGDAENTLVLAQAREQALALFGPAAGAFLPDIPVRHVRQAMLDALPSLRANLRGDERNVLLTLARMWWTAVKADFATKDGAATWAARRMPEPEAAALILARDAYLGAAIDMWDDRRAAAEKAADYLQARVIACLRPA